MIPTYSIHHFLNEPTPTRSFYVGRLEDMPQLDVLHIRYPHRHSFYEILWLESGSTCQFVDHQQYEVPPGSLFFISPGQVHIWEEWGHTTGWAVFFQPELGSPEGEGADLLFEMTFLDNLYASPWLSVPAPAALRLRPVLELLTSQATDADAERLIRALLRVLLLQIQEVATAAQPLRPPATGAALDLFRRFRQLLEQPSTPTRPQAVADYAARLCCTPDHLNRVARQVSGQTAGALVQARFALEARRLLAFEQSMPVVEVARRMGFADAAYFARAFRRATGMAPGEFRKLMSEKYRKRPR